MKQHSSSLIIFFIKTRAGPARPGHGMDPPGRTGGPSLGLGRGNHAVPGTARPAYRAVPYRIRPDRQVYSRDNYHYGNLEV